MALLLGIDTGGTYTDAILLDDVTNQIVAKAKTLTTRPDLAEGIGLAIDTVLTKTGAAPSSIAMVSLSTTLATNALVQGQGGRVALVFIGFNEADLAKANLAEAMGDDPVLYIEGGHAHSGAEAAAFDKNTFLAGLDSLSDSVTAIAIASKFATRNPAHEFLARDIAREKTGLPVTCSHELSAALGGPKRALTAVLNARLIAMIDQLIAATQAHIAKCGIKARLMVVRGDGALVSADIAREKPIETILSGPAASIAGAQWLTGAKDAVVSDIGGTTTDVCLLKDGQPSIDPQGAKVGKYRTMVEAVAMRTFGLGGDSEVRVASDLDGGLTLGPTRVVPLSLLAMKHPVLVHEKLDRALLLEAPQETATRFVVPQFTDFPTGLDTREAAVLRRLTDGPASWADAIQSRIEEPALARLVARGVVIVSDVTPSDASHVLQRMSDWDQAAAVKALTLFARRRVGNGDRLSNTPECAAKLIIDQLTEQTSLALLETSLAEEGWDMPATLACHPLMSAGRRDHSNVVRFSAGLALPVIGLGASAHAYYGAVGTSLGCDAILPENGDVANAIGAVVGQVSIHAEGSVTSAGEGDFRVHVGPDPQQFSSQDDALDALRATLTARATAQAKDAGVEDVQIQERLNLQDAQVEARRIFVEAKMRITASGRPRIAR